MSLPSQDSSEPNQTFGKNASFKLSQLMGSMSISPSGRDVVLGSREGLHIIDLDSPYSPPRFLPHQTPWEVADVQWSPFADRDHWVVSTSNQKALVWNLAAVGWRNSIEHVLHGHTRAITDINFSAHHPDRLATCAVDSFVHCWDLRSPARPATSFSDWFAGATQVKWSRQDEHVIASSHDKFLHIWDDRKGAYPARTIEAHQTKIYGIDWNRFEPSKIVTCSLDCTIKFWDTENAEDVPERVIETSFPVWRARHTPFGWGLMVMPQRGNGDLHFYDRKPVHGKLESGRVKPVHTFTGHKGQVKEFLWRASGNVKDGIDYRDFQLVSWGTDRELKLHAVSQEIFDDVGYEKGRSKPQRLRFTRRGARYRTFRDEPTEQDAAFSTISRTDSFPINNQFLRIRGRPSTNMGMSRAPMAQLKGWLQAGKHGRRTDMHGRGATRPDTDPISWMKNVKISAWDTDAMADEITQVGEKFSKVDFEAVNISQRRATMSLQSQWGEQASPSVYTRLYLKFPKGYPRQVAALITVQRTTSINADVQKRLTTDIRSIAEAHASRCRGCIEAVVRYLLREQTLEQIINWIMRDSLTVSKPIEAADLPQDASDDSDDDQLVSIPNVGQSAANTRVPRAKRCGALWSNNGKLVCFFSSKDKASASFLTTLGTDKLDESEPNKLFGGFGRIQVKPPSRRAKDAFHTTEDVAGSDLSDETSLYSSSPSSSDSSVGLEERDRFIPWQRMTLDSLQRTKSTDGSQKSTVLLGGNAKDTAPMSTISIHELSDILPARKELAQDYAVHGMPSHVCQHNAKAAEKHSLSGITAVWQILQMVFNNESVIHLRHTIETNPDLLVLARQMNNLIKDESFVERLIHAPPALAAHMQLPTSSSLGQFYILPAMLNYFDKRGDIQMLAMIASMLLQSGYLGMTRRIDSSIDAMLRSKHDVSAGYVASTEHTPLRSQVNHLSGRLTTNPHLLRARMSVTENARNHPTELSTSVPSSTLHTGYINNTISSLRAPSVVAHDPTGSVSAIHSLATSVAGSPENQRWMRKSEASVPYQPSTPGLHARARSRPASPPSTSAFTRLSKGTKSLKASPDDGFLEDARARLKSSLSLAAMPGHTNQTGTRRSGNEQPRPILKNGTAEPITQKVRKKKLKTRLSTAQHVVELNDHQFRLQHIELHERCVRYIMQYSSLLEVWQLWSKRTEMLQIVHQTPTVYKALDSNRRMALARPADAQGLEIRYSCQECGSVLTPIERDGVTAGWHCVSTDCALVNKELSRKQPCAICEVAVNGLAIPCLQCGHITCYKCAQEWFVHSADHPRKASDSSVRSSTSEVDHISSGGRTCPAGCDCNCPALSEISVPYPSSVTDRAAKKGEKMASATSTNIDEYTIGASLDPGAHELGTHRGQSVNGGPDSALHALLALNLQARQRSTSSTQTTALLPKLADHSSGGTYERGSRTRENSVSVADELILGANDGKARFGRGSGPELSRGLNNKASDAIT